MAAAAGEVLRPSLPEKAELSCDSPGELHVLAVDDSLVDRKVIERLLKISSCKVTAVESGTRALQFLGLDGEKTSVGFDSLKVNLIMTDYSMPGMTGYELLKRIKEEIENIKDSLKSCVWSESSNFREVPVVIMSSENILTRIDRCLEEGAEEFILKPVKLSDVNRLKNFIMKGEGKENRDRKLDKRKRLQDDISPSASLPPPPSPLSSPLPHDLEKLPRQQPVSASSLSLPRCSLKRPRLQHRD